MCCHTLLILSYSESCVLLLFLPCIIGPLWGWWSRKIAVWYIVWILCLVLLLVQSYSLHVEIKTSIIMCARVVPRTYPLFFVFFLIMEFLLLFHKYSYYVVIKIITLEGLLPYSGDYLSLFKWHWGRTTWRSRLCSVGIYNLLQQNNMLWNWISAKSHFVWQYYQVSQF